MANRKEKTTQPEISVIIGTLNRPTVILSLLKQLLLIKNVKIEVLVFDQSDNENYKRLNSQFPVVSHFHLFHLDIPNTCQYLNLGWQKAKAPIILYLDDDVEITESTLINHLKNYRHDQIKGVAGRVINNHESISENSLVGKINSFGAIFHKNFSFTSKTFVDFPYGCNMSFRKSILEKLNGFDERLSPPIYSYNEVDLGYRITSKYPQSIIFEPGALVYHRQYQTGGTRTYDIKKVNSSNSMNYGYFIAKNFTWWQNLFFLLRRFPYQILKEPTEIPNIIIGFIKGKFQKNHLWSMLLLLLFGLITLLRFWKIGELFFFGIDEEYQSLLALSIIKDFHIIWIGLSAANTGFYIGPGLVYIHSLLLWISKLDPIIFAYSASFIGIINAVVFYLVAKALFDKKTAIIGTFLYSLSSYVVLYDRRFWNSTFVPLTVMLFLYSLVKFRKNPNWLVVIAASLAFSFHIHASLFIFIPICIVLIFKQIAQDKIKIPLITYITSFLSFVLIYSPLIVFDMVHNFDNLKTPLRMMQSMGKGASENIFLSHFQAMLNTMGSFLMIPDSWILIKLLILIIIFCLFIVFFITNTLKGKHPALSTIISFYLIMFVFYPGKILDYYYLGFLPFLSIVVAFYLNKIPSVLLILAGIIYLGISINNIVKIPSNSGLTTKKELISKTIKYLGNSSFYLTTNQDYLYFGGWRYLFEAYGKKPESSQADQMFGWIYQKEISGISPPLSVEITEGPFTSKKQIIKVINNGPYNAYILKNN